MPHPILPWITLYALFFGTLQIALWGRKNESLFFYAAGGFGFIATGTAILILAVKAALH